MSFTLIVGGYANLITTLLFTLSGSGTGSLSQTSQIAGGNSPSWLALSPVNSSILYANQETTVGEVVSFTIDASGKLTQYDSAPTGGAGVGSYMETDSKHHGLRMGGLWIDCASSWQRSAALRCRQQ
ncbi:hypothetical protein FRB97_002068 [Tulasnella sp. 331]|nr:hypothetical protein FRB97_002068 [Tulasnella sp. 331]